MGLCQYCIYLWRLRQIDHPIPRNASIVQIQRTPGRITKLIVAVECRWMHRERGKGRGEGESMRSRQEKEARVGWVIRQIQSGIVV